MQFKIPQNVRREDRIVGPLTLKQLIICAIGGIIGYAIYLALARTYIWITWLPPVAIVAIITIAFAFIRPLDLSFTKWLLLWIQFSLLPRKRTWNKSSGEIIVSLKQKKAQEKKQKQQEELSAEEEKGANSKNSTHSFNMKKAMAQAPKTEASTASVKANKKKKNAGNSTQTFMRIAEIRDNAVVLKNGGIRAVINVSSINFNLKSEEEQNAIIYSYQGFLNTLDFPIQIVVRSKKLDIDEYLDDLREKGNAQTNKLLQQQTFEYVEYIAKLVEYADIMEKEFYVVVPVDPFRAQKLNIFQKFFQNMNPKDTFSEIKKRHNEFQELKKKLNQRVNTVRVGLENCGLKVNQLSTKELVELFYRSYNPTVARHQKMKNFEQERITPDEATPLQNDT